MAIYYYNVQIISRGAGRSAVAAAAYRAGEHIKNNWDGVDHDYTHKTGIAYTEIMLPDNAPEAYHNRTGLWNAVEDDERQATAQLAREIVVALPNEFTLEQNVDLIQDYVQRNFVSKGMCADIAIHVNEKASVGTGELVQNIHVHIMLTMRPINEEGAWEPKAQKLYVCIRDGQECNFTAEDYKTAKENGWEKQYQYRDGKEKMWLTADEGSVRGLTRIDRNPKSIKEKNPIVAEWDSRETMLQWRKDWADTVNHALESVGVDARIDHRSYEEQGLLRVGGTHLGPNATALERQGYLTELGDENRAAAEANQRIDIYLGNAQELEDKMTKITNSEYVELKNDRKEMGRHHGINLHRGCR